LSIVRPTPLADLAMLRESVGRDDEDDDFEMKILRRRLTRRRRLIPAPGR
jgi:hypothetical protein